MSPEDRRLGPGDVAMMFFIPLIVAFLASGCALTGARRRSEAPAAASIPSDMKTPYVANAYSADVLQGATKHDRLLLSSALESMQEAGAVAYVEREVALRNPDGSPVIDTSGNPVILRQRSVCKVNSLKEIKELQKVGKVTLVLAGQAPVTLPDGSTDEIMAAMIEGLRLEVDQVEGAKIDSEVAEIVAARAAERAAIIDGWTKLTEAEWGGRIEWVGAIGDATAIVTTSAGEQAVKILKVVTPEGAALEALRLLVERPDGETEEIEIAK